MIDVLRGRKEVVRALESLERSGVPTYCTGITWAEVFAGVRPREEAVTEQFLGRRGEVVIDAACGRKAGSYLARYAGSDGVEIADALIAAAATTSGLKLWTHNRRHYPMPDLELYEPS